MLNLIHIKSCFFYTYMFLEIAKLVAKNGCFKALLVALKIQKIKQETKSIIKDSKKEAK